MMFLFLGASLISSWHSEVSQLALNHFSGSLIDDEGEGFVAGSDGNVSILKFSLEMNLHLLAAAVSLWNIFHSSYFLYNHIISIIYDNICIYVYICVYYIWCSFAWSFQSVRSLPIFLSLSKEDPDTSSPLMGRSSEIPFCRSRFRMPQGRRKPPFSSPQPQQPQQSQQSPQHEAFHNGTREANPRQSRKTFMETRNAHSICRISRVYFLEMSAIENN